MICVFIQQCLRFRLFAAQERMMERHAWALLDSPREGWGGWSSGFYEGWLSSGWHGSVWQEPVFRRRLQEFGCPGWGCPARRKEQQRLRRQKLGIYLLLNNHKELPHLGQRMRGWEECAKITRRRGGCGGQGCDPLPAVKRVPHWLPAGDWHDQVRIFLPFFRRLLGCNLERR